MIDVVLYLQNHIAPGAQIGVLGRLAARLGGIIVTSEELAARPGRAQRLVGFAQGHNLVACYSTTQADSGELLARSRKGRES